MFDFVGGRFMSWVNRIIHFLGLMGGLLKRGWWCAVRVKVYHDVFIKFN